MAAVCRSIACFSTVSGSATKLGKTGLRGPFFIATHVLTHA